LGGDQSKTRALFVGAVRGEAVTWKQPREEGVRGHYNGTGDFGPGGVAAGGGRSTSAEGAGGGGARECKTKEEELESSEDEGNVAQAKEHHRLERLRASLAVSKWGPSHHLECSRARAARLRASFTTLRCSYSSPYTP
jgi:hypothetical protein